MYKEPLPPTSKDKARKIREPAECPAFRRINFRKNNEIRDMFLKLGDIDTADGHCFYSLGNTKVVCTVYGPKPENRGSYSELGRIRLRVAKLLSKPYDTAYEQRDTEIEGLLTEVVNHIIFLEKYRGCCIYIRCVIIKSDGGELSSVLTSISLALIKSGIETHDIISAISVGSLRCLNTNKTYNLVDLDDEELMYYKDKYEINLLTIGICYNAKNVCFFNGSCSSISNKSFAEILNFGEGACRALGDMLKKSVQEHLVKKHFTKTDIIKIDVKKEQHKKESEIKRDKRRAWRREDIEDEFRNEFKRQDTGTEDEDEFIEEKEASGKKEKRRKCAQEIGK